MATLWTDVIDPATLTGYTRESLSAYEAKRGSLAQFLPNYDVADNVARFVAGGNGLIEEARYRAYDAEPEIGESGQGRRVTIQLPAISQGIPVSEYQQLRERNASDQAVLKEIFKTTDRVVRAIADRVERTRGIVLTTGRATIDQSNFQIDDDFGRDPRLTVIAPTLWSDPDADILDQIQTWVDLYSSINGTDPGVMLVGAAAERAITSNKAFALRLLDGAQRRATVGDVANVLAGAQLPRLVTYKRRTATGPVIPADTVLLLPEPVDADDWQGTELGATYWGQTLTASDSKFSLQDVDMPGLVAGVWRNDKPPMIAEVIGDAITLPVLANANLSMAVKVL